MSFKLNQTSHAITHHAESQAASVFNWVRRPYANSINFPYINFVSFTQASYEVHVSKKKKKTLSKFIAP